MSPDNYKSHPFVKRMVEASNAMTTAFPQLSHYLIHQVGDMRGLTMFVGDTAEYVVGLRAFNGVGEPVVCWSSGDDPLLALLNLEKALADHRWIIDKKAVARSAGESPAHQS